MPFQVPCPNHPAWLFQGHSAPWPGSDHPNIKHPNIPQLRTVPMEKVSGLYVDLYVCIALQLHNNKKCDLEAVCFFLLALVFGECIF